MLTALFAGSQFNHRSHPRRESEDDLRYPSQRPNSSSPPFPLPAAPESIEDLKIALYW
jgi:hypothetical protein